MPVKSVTPKPSRIEIKYVGGFSGVVAAGIDFPNGEFVEVPASVADLLSGNSDFVIKGDE